MKKTLLFIGLLLLMSSFVLSDTQCGGQDCQVSASLVLPAPNITLLAISDTVTDSRTYYFDFFDSVNITANCSLYRDGILLYNGSTPNATTVSVVDTGFAIGLHSVFVNCTNDYGHVGVSVTRTFRRNPTVLGGGGSGGGNITDVVEVISAKGQCDVNLLPLEFDVSQPRIWVESSLRNIYISEQVGNLVRIHNVGDEPYNTSRIYIKEVIAKTPFEERLMLSSQVLNIPPNGTGIIVIKPTGIYNIQGKGFVVLECDRCYDLNIPFDVDITYWKIFVNGMNDAVDEVAGWFGGEPPQLGVVPAGELENPFVKIWNYLKELIGL